MKADTMCYYCKSKHIARGVEESLHAYINRGGHIFERNITTLENMPIPSSRSHLSSSPMGVFSRDYSICVSLQKILAVTLTRFLQIDTPLLMYKYLTLY